MYAGDTTLRKAKKAEIPAIKELLRASGLPHEDVDPARQDLIVAVRKQEILGCIGVEKYGEHGLLRSLAVGESCRGKGLGTELVEKLIAHSRAGGVKELYLLTLTADRFFENLEFSRLDREAVPAAIGQTTEFESICPVSSICMKRAI